MLWKPRGDCCNIVRTFGDDDLKQAFAKLEIARLPDMLHEVQRRISIVNQKEAFQNDDSTRLLVSDAMEDITFSFQKIGEEEMKMISGGVELNEKWQKVVHSFAENIDQDDPDFITLQEAFMQRFKEHGFVVNSTEEFMTHSRTLDEIIKKLRILQKQNKVLMHKYNDDVKFARIHKRIKEENNRRKNAGGQVIISDYDEKIMELLSSIKADVDGKVYDRNDILKKDAYFEQTVMREVKQAMDKLSIKSSREDRVFIQIRIAKQYLSQYNMLYSA